MAGIRMTDTSFYKRVRDFKDALSIALIVDQKYTMLPEIYEVFGRDLMLKFIDIFGGMSIDVPSQEDLVNTIRNVQFYIDVINRENGKPTFRELAESYGFTKSKALRIFNDIKTKVERFDGVPLDPAFLPKGEEVIDDDE